MHDDLAQQLLETAPAPLLRQLTRPWSPPRGCRIVVGVSGGADSVALGLLLGALAGGRGWSVLLASLDHERRGRAGADDRRFVERLARQAGLESRTVRRPAPGDEAAARRVRRHVLQEIAAAEDAAAIALAHTMDDQAETVLHRLARGTGTAGLGAMQRWSAPWWRPLLGVRRDALRRLLHRCGMAWREDETNLAPDATRNRLRRRALPALAAALERDVVPALARAAELAQIDEELLAALAAEQAAHVARRTTTGVELDRRALCELAEPLARRLLLAELTRLVGGERLAATHVEAVLALARASGPGTAADLPLGWRATRRGATLTLAPAAAETSDDARGRESTES